MCESPVVVFGTELEGAQDDGDAKHDEQEIHYTKDTNMPLVPERFFRPALSSCGVSCMI